MGTLCSVYWLAVSHGYFDPASEKDQRVHTSFFLLLSFINTPSLLVGMKTVKTTLEISLVVPQKIGHEDPAIPLMGIYPEDNATCNKDTYSTIYNSQKLD